MSKTTLIQELRKEINHLNDVIDLKIIRGIPYKNEARRHRFLVTQLTALSRTPGVRPLISETWLSRVSHMFTSFIM